MQYKGFKMIKRVAAVIVSAAIMLVDIQGVSAAGIEQAFAVETMEVEMQDDSAQTGMDEGLSVEDFDAETQTIVSAETIQTSVDDTALAESVETEAIQVESDEKTETESTQDAVDETQAEMSENKIEEPEQILSEAEEPTDASEVVVDDEVIRSDNDVVQFRYHSEDNKELITQMPIAISINEPVTIAAVFGMETLPVGAKVQWASSKNDYVNVKERADIVDATAVTLEGLKPTTDLDSSVKVTCILIYIENGKQVTHTGVLGVTVNPLAESVSIQLGTNDATGKTAIYDIETERFIAIDGTRLLEPVEYFRADVYPTNASQKVIWKSSNTSIMKFEDENSGVVIGMGAGETTITATTTDGSTGADKKPVKGTVRVKARRVIQNLSFTAKSTDKNGTILEPDEKGRIEITSGASFYLEPTYSPADATERLISWSVGNNKSAVDIADAGNNVLKVTAKNVTSNTELTLTAKTTDMSEITRDIKVIIKPRVEKIKICPLNENGVPGDSVSGKSIGVDPDDPKCPQSYILKAINEPENASQKVTWEISNEKIATLEILSENTCKVTAKEKGTAVIKAIALDGSKMTAVTTFNVVSLATGVEINGSTKVMKGKTIKLTATAVPKSVTNVKFKWESLTPDIASVNANTGEVLGKKWGIAVISATADDGSGKMATHNVEVTDPPETFSIINGEEEIITGKTVGIDPDIPTTTDGSATSTFSMKILPETACQQVEWKSSNEKIATVKSEDDHAVVITAKAIGKTTITAKAVDGSGKTARIQVNVNTLSKNVEITGRHYLAKDMTLQLRAEVGDKDAANKSVVWKSDAPSLVEVDQTGLVTAVGEKGDARVRITAETVDGSGKIAEHFVYVVNKKNKVDINVINDAGFPPSIDKNNNKLINVDLSGKESVSIDLQATMENGGGYGKRDNKPWEVRWSTSSKSIATVEADEDNPEIGHVTIYKGGTVKIAATSTEGYESSKTITIKVENDRPYVKITGSGHRLARGKKLKLSTGGVPVTWESSNNGIAKVDNKGQVTADRYDDGSVTIKATAIDGGISNNYTIEVGDPVKTVQLTLNGRELKPNEKIGVDIINGYNGVPSIKLGAYLVFDDDTTELAGENVVWKSSNKAIATIDEDCNVELKKIGNVTFTATATDGSNKKAKVTLMIAKQLTDIKPAGNDTVYVGAKKSIQLQLKCTPFAAAKRKIIWESDDPSVCSVGKTNGKITGKIAGESTTIRATAADNSTVTCEFTVYVETPVSKVKIVKTSDGESYEVYGIDLSKDDIKPLELEANLYVKEDGEEKLHYISDVTWSSSNKNIATVDENGRVTGLKNGEVTITATATDGSKKLGKVKVYCGKLIESITDTEPSHVLSEGIKLNLRSKNKKVIDLSNKLKIAPITATNQKLTYTSLDKTVATVSANGKVTAKGEGTTWIVVTPKDGSGATNNMIKYISVEVEDPYTSGE